MTGLNQRQRLILKAMANDPDTSDDDAGTPWRTAAEVAGLLKRVNTEDIEPLDETESPTVAGEHIAASLDELHTRGFLEKRDAPASQYRRVWRSMPWDVVAVRQIQQRRTACQVVSGKAEEGVVLVDQITATLLMAVHDSVSEKNRQTLVSMDVIEAVNLCWRLHERGAISMGFKAA
jgi:hypothetical protein